ncbi:MAG: ATP-binding protein, partial [Verrucomicrobiota bacterium]
YIGGKDALIQELSIENNKFSLGSDDRIQNFSIRIFKIYSPGSQHSKISLIAHQREVTEVSTHSYVPEFIDEFYDKLANGNNNKERNYIVKSYVLGQYLDDHVSLERGGFEFNTDKEILNTIEQSNIELKAAELTKNAIGQEITVRQEKKQNRVTQYIEQDAPWHRKIVEELDLSSLSYNASDEDIEIELQKIKIKKEVEQKKKVTHVLEKANLENSDISIQELVDEISENSKNDLVHYVASRRLILDIFRKSLQRDKEGKYSSEGLMHDIIFPRKASSETIEYEQQNLWIIDERLNFTTYLASDLPLKGNSDRPDIINYGQRVAFRGDNVKSNPITIFEFKKPGKDSFINPSAWKENPVQQIMRYVNKIRKGEFKTPEGRNIQVEDKTPFYGYIICEISKKVEEWLHEEQSFQVLPDGLGWFRHEPNIHLYMEALSWDKLLDDADMRNKIFFKKLGI